MKRGTDFLFALLGLLILWPVFVAVAAAIKLFDDGPVFFVQVRVGQDGRLFRMLKFRTMVVRQESAAELTVGHDSRITRPGRVLRRFKLDELPQLWNVLKGEMSLVGPRPEVEKYVNLYTATQREVLKLKPGITDPASFAFFDESELLSRYADPERFYRDQLLGEKIRINLDYAGKATFSTDVLLVGATVGRALGFNFDLFRWLQIEMPRIKN